MPQKPQELIPKIFVGISAEKYNSWLSRVVK